MRRPITVALAAAAMAASAAAVAPTAARAAVAPDTASVATLGAENFDALADQLQARVDETGIPATLTGFTHTPPTGWTVSNDAAMAGLGAEEWRGWSFATPAFWQAAQRGQGREDFTLGSGVIAVADNDEWDDLGTPRGGVKMNSRLTSPAWDVAGRSRVYVNFASNYRQVQGQVAALDVSFDGGPARRLFQWDYQTMSAGGYDRQVSWENRAITRAIDVPDGASTVQVTFAVENADNDWYWAVDNITLTDAPRPGGHAALPLPQAPGREDFDSLNSQLSTRSHETAIPADQSGFTHTPPAGWTVTNAPAMDGLGTNEWRGWSFATPQFWADAEKNQGREDFTLGSGVIAVADDDEWDDLGTRPSGVKFASTLSSPAWDVSGRARVYVNFASTYRQTQGQVAGLDVSFDGGPSTRLFQWDSDSLSGGDYDTVTPWENQYLTQAVDVPASASTARVSFVVENADNDWYWAVDDISLTDEPAEGAVGPMPPSPLADLPDGTSPNKVVLIDVDGLTWDKVTATDTPNLDALGATGQFGPMYVPGTDLAPTVSGPGHSSILTGVWPDKHGVHDNTFAGSDIAHYPDLFTRVETARPQLSTMSTLDWSPINQYIIGNPDVKVQQSGSSSLATDTRSTALVVRALTEKNPDLAYLYLHSPDGAGHGYGVDSPQYTDAVELVDRLVGQVVDAARARPTYAQENWLFLLTSDHGMYGTGHGGNEHTTRESVLLAAGGDIPAAPVGAHDWKQVDIVPTVLHHLGIPADPAWGLDGQAIGTPSADPFDTLTPRLDGPVDEAPKPHGLLGWTKSAPGGWQIDERTPAVGVTEYRGWSFVTPEFWATSQLGQGRESFADARGVIAVADADEWDDKGGPTASGARMDSTLLSPWQAVRPGGTVDVSYLSHYRQVGRATDPQKAQLVLRYDNGAEQVLWSADNATGDQFDISTPESFHATAPDAATHVRAGWRLFDAANNFYWAIDNPSVHAEAPAAWSASAPYAAGDLVTFQGSTWQAQWWTRDQAPGDPYGPWAELAITADGATRWTPSRVFVSGDTASYQGRTYVAQWWTRNQAPGDPHGPWTLAD